MPNIAHELFLLSTNLSQFKSKELITKFFVESINSIFLNQNFVWKTVKSTCIDPCIIVCTRTKTYGYIQFTKQELFTNETFSLFQNSIQLLAIYLEKQEQELLLKNQKVHLDILVNKKTFELQKSKEELEKKKEESERKNEELKERNTFIQTILDNLPIGLAANNIDTNTAFYLNNKLEEIYGWPKDEINSIETFFQKVYPDKEYHDKIMAMVISDIQSGDPGRMHWENIQITTSDGTKKYINAVNIPLFEQNTMISTVMDVTDLYNTQLELTKAKEIAEASEVIKSKMVANIGDVIVIIDKQGLNRYKSPNIEKLFGWKPEELVGKSTFDNVHQDDLEKCSLFFKDLVGSPNKTGSIELRYKHKNGKYSWIRFTACNLLDDPVIKGILGNYHDITDQKKHEQDMVEKNFQYESLNEELTQTNEELFLAKEIVEESKEKYRRLTENAKDMIYSMSLPDGQYKYVSPSSLEVFGYYPEEFYNSPMLIAKVIHPDFVEYFKTEWEKLVEGNLSPTYEYKIFSKKGKEKWLHQRNQLIRDINNNPVAIEGIVTDITDRKNAEQALLESEKQLRLKNKELLLAKQKAEEASRLKTEFLNNMSHEVRTPMNGIIGFSQMFDKPDITNEKRRYYSKIVQSSSQQLLRIIDDILEIATIESRQQKISETSFCLNDFLMEIFSIYNWKLKEHNIPLHIKKGLNDIQSIVISDKVKLNRILGNLIENALKFTTDGFIEFGYYVKGDRLCLYVKDTGIGISSENLESIFDRFSQEEKEISRKHGGLGLGLSISRENAKLLGGDITVESEKGKGSTFYVTIPYKPDQNKIKSVPELTAPQTKKDGEFIILVAEDEEVNFLYIEALFENEFSEKYHLIHAKNGREALDICFSGTKVDLVLMDLKMPVMNGYEATKKIKSSFPKLPIIAQTAYSTEADKLLAFKHGCDDFISKPLNKEVFFGLLNKYLNKE